MADYYVIPTNIGEAKMANALALGIPLAITELALGDGEGEGARGTPIPNPEATALVSERRRAPLNSFSVDPENSNVLIAEQVIPETAGGWWIREMGLFDEDGDLIFVCNTPPTYKPQLAEGSGRTQVVRMASIVSDTAAVTLKVDPSVVLATREYAQEILAVHAEDFEKKINARTIYVGSVAELKVLSVSIGASVNTLGYYAPGDGGGNDYEIVAGATGTADGGRFIDLDNGLQAKGLFLDGSVHVEQFGATGDGNDFDPLANCAAYAFSQGKRYIHVDCDITITGKVPNLHNVIPIGDGSISGAYRRHVYPLRTKSLLFNNINPKVHLKTFRRADPAKVVFIGDSLMTYAANSNALTTTLPGLLEAKINQDNIGKTITYVNRAIGGTRWVDIDGIPDNTSASWYTDPLRDWLEYVNDEQPDMVIISFGMNGSYGFNLSEVESVVAKIQSWSKVPDIVFCTPLVPTIEPTEGYESFGTFADQEGRDKVAQSIRLYCKKYDFPFIDINRICNLVRDGFDITEQSLREVHKGLDVSASGFFVADEETRAFKIKASIDDQSYIDALNADTAQLLTIRLSSNLAYDSSSLFIRNSGDGSNQFQIDLFAFGELQERFTPPVPLPTSPFTIFVEVKGATCVVSLRETQNDQPLARTDLMIVPGGLFKPAIGYQGLTGGPVSTIDYYQGEDELYLPHLTDNEIWGAPTLPVETKQYYGGNGLNHPSSLGVSAIYYPAIAGADFRAEVAAGEVYTLGLPVYLDNTEAIAGGLKEGDAYRTSDGTIKTVY